MGLGQYHYPATRIQPGSQGESPMTFSRTRAFILGACVSALPAVERPSPVSGQEYAVSRRAFTFFDTRLDIEVAATSAGQLQILRGESGRIDVAAHAAEGLASFALATEMSPTLSLTAAGAKQSEYIVSVPERVTVRVKLPGRSGWSSAEPFGVSRFRWDSVPEPTPIDYSTPRPTVEDRYFVVGSSAAAPGRVRMFGKAHLRVVEVRMEGIEFQLWSSRPLTNQPGAKELVDVDAGREDVDLVIQVPSFSRQFELRLENEVMLTIEGGKLIERCGPGVKQKAANGSVRLKYRPSAGLVCGAARVH